MFCQANMVITEKVTVCVCDRERDILILFFSACVLFWSSNQMFMLPCLDSFYQTSQLPVRQHSDTRNFSFLR